MADRLTRAGQDTGPDHLYCVELDSCFSDLACLKVAMRKAGARVKKLKETRPPATVDEKLSLCLNYLSSYRLEQWAICKKIAA